MKITLEALKKVAEELNELLQPDPLIKVNTKSTVIGLSEEIKATAEIIADDDSLSQLTFDILTEMEIDLPAKIKVKKEDEVTSMKKEKSTAKVVKKPTVEKDTSLSNKAICYLAWKEKKDIAISVLHKKVKENVKEVTIKIWTQQWSNGKNLPAVAK